MGLVILWDWEVINSLATDNTLFHVEQVKGKHEESRPHRVVTDRENAGTNPEKLREEAIFIEVAINVNSFCKQRNV